MFSVGSDGPRVGFRVGHGVLDLATQGLGRVFELPSLNPFLAIRNGQAVPEEHYKELDKKMFPDLRVGLLHGRMAADLKEQVMRLFQKGEIDILVATTVIEVGVDVANASVMVIEHAERFGLSQLHQLRGRIGRGAAKSYCVLMTGGKVSEDGERRLDAMVRTNDGFKIAELDLELRGPGEFFGTRQAGMPSFQVANLIRDRQLLEAAKREAAAVLAGEDVSAKEAAVAEQLVRMAPCAVMAVAGDYNAGPFRPPGRSDHARNGEERSSAGSGGHGMFVGRGLPENAVGHACASPGRGGRVSESRGNHSGAIWGSRKWAIPCAMRCEGR